jgi:hypothetical protein
MCSAKNAGIGTMPIYLIILNKSACDELSEKRASNESPDHTKTEIHSNMK